MTRRIITVERVYEPASECNAVRLRVDRLRPRGLKRENLQYASDARPVVLLTASKDLPYGHAQVLADYLAELL